MKWTWGLAAAVLAAMPAFASDDCGRQPKAEPRCGECAPCKAKETPCQKVAKVANECNPCQKAPAPRYVTIKVPVKKLVPERGYKIVCEEVPYTAYQTVQKEVPYKVKKPFWEEQEITVEQPVQKEVEKTFKVCVLNTKEETIERRVCKTVRKVVDQEVEEITGYEKVCNPETGKLEKIAVKQKKTVPITTYEKVWETVPCKVRTSVPEIKEEVRKVTECVWEPTQVKVKVRVLRDVDATKTVCEKVPVTLTKTVKKKVPVCTYKEVTECVKKKVLESEVQAEIAKARAEYLDAAAPKTDVKKADVKETPAKETKPAKEEVAPKAAVKPDVESPAAEAPTEEGVTAEVVETGTEVAE
ncbi:MAG: hypothetical protein LBP75_06765 [Planctomycetota bacterium]|jgi:hypothetical protein|nr:hypothetical protein [Planctomycetota bacterium]